MEDATLDRGSRSSVSSSDGGIGAVFFVASVILIGLFLRWYKQRRESRHAIQMQESPQELRERLIALREKRLQKLQAEETFDCEELVYRKASSKDTTVNLRRRKSPTKLSDADEVESRFLTVSNNKESTTHSWQEEQRKYFKIIQTAQQIPKDNRQECATQTLVSPSKLEAMSRSDEGTVSTINDSFASTTENLKIASPLKQQKSKKMTFRPPPQLLCEALSQIFNRNVVVESKLEAGSWGGEGWKKRTSNFTITTPIILPLHLHQPTSIDHEWDALRSVFPKLLDRSLCSKLFPKRDVKLAALCHHRARAIYRNGFVLVKDGDEGFAVMRSCVKTLYLWLTAQVAKWIRPDVEAAKAAIAADDEEISDLFSDEYCGEISTSTFSNTCTTEPLDTLFSLLEDSASPIVTADFLEDLFRAYNGSSAEDQQLARILLSQALKQLALAKQSSSFSSATLTRRITALSSLLSAPSVCQTLSSMIQEEVAQMGSKNGREIQDIISLAPLFEAAAYATPSAGAEREEGFHKVLFLQQMEAIKDFPTSAFRAGGIGETGRIMDEARRTMKTARHTAEFSLHVAFKGGNKDHTFKWLANVIRSK